MDLVSDADVDPGSASAMDNTVAWCENLGDGSLGPHPHHHRL
ncbi:MAG: hypothetical protein ACPGPE_11815 [Planctomycetota bacterium]